MKAANYSWGKGAFLKGLAIISVVIIHILGTVVFDRIGDTWYFPYMLIVDQAARFSVPLFIALTGYGLTKKYLDKPFQNVAFLRSRFIKILPLHIVWTLVYFSIFRVTSWDAVIHEHTLISTIYWGTADYQFYYVFILLKLYLLFALIQSIPKKIWWVVVLILLSMQAYAYQVFSHIELYPLAQELFNWDQVQYRLLMTWAGYLSFGMWWAYAQPKITRNFRRIMLIGSPLILFWQVRSVIQSLDQGLSLRRVTQTTTIPVFIWAMVVIIYALQWLDQTNPLKSRLTRIISSIGQQSYVIFLSHTLFMRLFIVQGYYPIPVSEWRIALAIGIVGLYVSHTFITGRILWRLPIHPKHHLN